MSLLSQQPPLAVLALLGVSHQRESILVNLKLISLYYKAKMCGIFNNRVLTCIMVHNQGHTIFDRMYHWSGVL